MTMAQAWRRQGCGVKANSHGIGFSAAARNRYGRFMPDLTSIDSEFAAGENAAAYDAWFRAKVERAMASTEPGIPHETVMAEMQAIIDRVEHR